MTDDSHSSGGELDSRFKLAHNAIAVSAKAHNATDSCLVNGSISRHILPSTISFSNLTALHSAVKEANRSVAQYDFVATSGCQLIFSSKFNFIPIPDPIASHGASRKRRRDARDDQEDAVVAARRRLAKNSTVSVPSEELDMAQDVLVKMVTELRGPSHEILVQSYCMLIRKLQKTDDRARVVLAMRLNAGIPVPVSQLKRCLGACWRDGVLSTNSSVNGVCDHDLPLTEEGSASMELGNLPMLVVTSVPMHC